MRKLGVLFLFLVLLAPAALEAAADQPPEPAQPAQPELVLPQVTLDIQDLSVENIQAMLPPTPPVNLAGAAVLLPASPELAVQ
ncbi:MAG: hypothetical protein ABSG17_19145, partial [Spirochaetia bacterium]